MTAWTLIFRRKVIGRLTSRKTKMRQLARADGMSGLLRVVIIGRMTRAGISTFSRILKR